MLLIYYCKSFHTSGGFYYIIFKKKYLVTKKEYIVYTKNETDDNGNVTITSLDQEGANIAKRMIDETGCDLVMIGRGVLGNPWLIKETIDYLEYGVEPKEITIEEKIDGANLGISFDSNGNVLLQMKIQEKLLKKVYMPAEMP